MSNRIECPDIQGAKLMKLASLRAVYELKHRSDCILVLQTDGVYLPEAGGRHVRISRKGVIMNALAIMNARTFEAAGIPTDMVAYGVEGLSQFIGKKAAKTYAPVATIRRKISIPSARPVVYGRLSWDLLGAYMNSRPIHGLERSLPEGLSKLDMFDSPLIRILGRTREGAMECVITESDKRLIREAFRTIVEALRPKGVEMAASKVSCGYDGVVPYTLSASARSRKGDLGSSVLILSADGFNPFESCTYERDTLHAQYVPRRNDLAHFLRAFRDQLKCGRSIGRKLYADATDDLLRYFTAVSGMTLDGFACCHGLW
ncbi:MAG: hypothetical protein HGA38_00905 [Candidatus Moranbacteria bacterium]|nr:hypothetical protein [Candidatus Moranbacteria bacterium]